jgi:Holliday junction resolvasome RuvABC DNA-binding subunit
MFIDFHNLSKISEAVKHSYRRGTYSFDNAVRDLVELGYSEDEAEEYLLEATTQYSY